MAIANPLQPLVEATAAEIALEPIMVGILSEPDVEERPGEPFLRRVEICHSAEANFRVLCKSVSGSTPIALVDLARTKCSVRLRCKLISR